MEFKNYLLGDTIVSYLINEDKNVSMLVYPKSKADEIKNPWDIKNENWSPRAVYNHSWHQGALAYFFTSQDDAMLSGITYKSDSVTHALTLKDQRTETVGNKTSVITELTHEKGYTVVHTVSSYENLRGLEINTSFINTSDNDVNLEYLTSFALDNLSPFREDDGNGCFLLHRYYGGWSREGKPVTQTIEELGLENTWGAWSGANEKFGCRGSYPVERYFPAAVFEDKSVGIAWGAQLAHNSTWQMEVTRMAASISFTGGLGDKEFCGWNKTLKSGESLDAPKAYISAVVGSAEEAMSAVLDLHKTKDPRYIEDGLPIAFNEYCTTWGKPTQEKMLTFCDILKPYGVKYLVIDAGWCFKGHEQDFSGEWPVDKEIFPDIKGMCDTIRKNGMIPGIWFEFEVTTKGSRMFEKDYDNMHLTRDGRVIKNGGWRSYWDFRREDVREYLHEKVIKMLKDNGFGYIKVDYNANIGNTVDGAESGPENLRQHLNAVREFFKEMKDAIPDLVIENCASGGHRLEPSMFEVSSVSSFSDAHESVEIPYIAANLQSLMLPEQSLIWAVLHNDETPERTIYSLAATFLGRICLSGEVDNMNDEQKVILKTAFDYYHLLTDVIKNGDTKIYGNRGESSRFPTGTQAVVRKTEREVLVVCHAFQNPSDTIEIDLGAEYKIKGSFYADGIYLDGTKLVIEKMASLTAKSVLLEKC